MARRNTGVLLMEVLVALGIILAGMVSLFPLVKVNAGARQSSAEADFARLAVADVADLLRRSDFELLYETYEGAVLPAANLISPAGQPAVVAVQCFVDELNIPREFGPVVDLNGIGGLETSDCSTTYRLLPIRLSLTYLDRGGITHNVEIFLLLERGS